MHVTVKCPRCLSHAEAWVYPGDKITFDHDCPYLDTAKPGVSELERQRLQRLRPVRLEFDPPRPIF